MLLKGWRLSFRFSFLGMLLWCGVFMIGTSGIVAIAGAQYRVSQKGRAFTPNLLDMQRGESIEFVNDDGDLLHHAYIESDPFSFDTGDLEPGSKVVVAFPMRGTFMVLCGIHPKMKLLVRVH